MARNTVPVKRAPRLPDRREFVRDSLVTAAGIAAGFPSPAWASWLSAGKTLLVRAGSLGLRGAGGLGGLVLTEGILGILKAYDIDISAWVEGIVRDLTDRDRGRAVAVAQARPIIRPNIPTPKPRPIPSPKPRPSPLSPPSGTAIQFQLSSGTCPSGSEISLLYDGYDIRIRQHGNPIWSMGLVFWGATRDLSVDVKCLSSLNCGHPVADWVSRDAFGKNYRYLEQQFEGGLVRLVIDLHLPRTLDNVFERNQHVDVWIPGRS